MIFRISFKTRSITVRIADEELIPEYFVMRTELMEAKYLCPYCLKVQKLVSEEDEHDFLLETKKNHETSVGLSRQVLQEFYIKTTGDGSKILFSLPESLAVVSKIKQLTIREALMFHPINLKLITLAIIGENLTIRSYTGYKWGQRIPQIMIKNLHETQICRAGLDPDYYTFLTCHEDIQSKIDFKAYILPFEFSVWVVTIALMVLMYITVNVASSITLGSTPLRFRLMLEMFGLFLNAGVELSPLLISKPLRGLLTVWLFMCLILNTAYRGDSFSKIVAPAKIQRATKFSDIMSNFSIYSRAVNSGYFWDFPFRVAGKNWMETALREALQMRKKSGKFENRQFLKGRGTLIIKLSRQLIPISNNEYLRNSSQEILNRLGTCRSTAVVVHSVELRQLFMEIYNQYKAHHIYMGEQRLFEKQFTIITDESGGNYYNRKLSWLEYSGLQGLWSKLLKASFKPVHLSGIFSRGLFNQKNTILLSHLNWLNDFKDCENTVVFPDTLIYTPNEQSQPSTPTLLFLNDELKFPTLIKHTNCHTITMFADPYSSFVPNHYGRVMSLNHNFPRKHYLFLIIVYNNFRGSQIKPTVPYLSQPSRFQIKFHRLTFAIIYNAKSDSYQSPKEISMGNDIFEVNFICEYCIRSKSHYNLEVHNVENTVKTIALYRKEMDKTVLSAGSNGKQFAYNLDLGITLTSSKDLSKLKQWYYAKSLFDVQKSQLTPEQVLLLVLAETIPSLQGFENLTQNYAGTLMYQPFFKIEVMDIYASYNNIVLLDTSHYTFLSCIDYRPNKQILRTVNAAHILAVGIVAVFQAAVCGIAGNLATRIKNWKPLSEKAVSVLSISIFVAYIAITLQHYFYFLSKQISTTGNPEDNGNLHEIRKKNVTVLSEAIEHTAEFPFETEFGQRLWTRVFNRSRLTTEDGEFYPVWHDWMKYGFLAHFDFYEKQFQEMMKIYPKIQPAFGNQNEMMTKIGEDCEHRTLAVSSEAALQILRRPRKLQKQVRIFKGEEKLFETMKYFRITTNGGEYVGSKIEQIFNSGIYQFWKQSLFT
ncbi:unnamed protein product [Orchesella dallaii]|uniref:Uncharacterized protein n=1 Tax=Orchesella dallaii TaxID=48710 RepID=A0ABP1S910_9HEXA